MEIYEDRERFTCDGLLGGVDVYEEAICVKWGVLNTNLWNYFELTFTHSADVDTVPCRSTTRQQL